MNIENYPTLGPCVVPPVRPCGFNVSTATAAASDQVEDFSDRRVLFTLAPVSAERFGRGSGLSYSQSANGPTRADISRDVSDANLDIMAKRNELGIGQLRAFRDHAGIGASMLAATATTPR